MGAEEPKNDPGCSDVPVTRRQPLARHAEATTWLDRLLVASSGIAPGATLEDAAATLVFALAEVLPDAAVGVCLATGETGQVIVRHAPRESQPTSPDPTRLFPRYAHERSLPIDFEESSTVHVACDDDAPFEEGGPYHALLDRLAFALGAAMRHSRAYDRARAERATMRGLEAQVIQSAKLASLGQIAAGIVHELNNPLTSIVAYSDYLRKKAETRGSDPADVERLSRINEAAERILRFARDLVAYSRPSPEVPAPVAIHDVIARALVFCEHLVDDAGVVVDRAFTADRLVRGVSGQLTQVFVNLITNACHAMQGGGGRLTIATETAPDDQWVIVTIADEGHGIEAEHIARIFDPFFTTKAEGGGTGLGLSIVHNIVTSHGGHIRVGSQAPRGTVFQIELPIAASPDGDSG
jgi:signal transduction histidine kinase